MEGVRYPLGGMRLELSGQMMRNNPKHGVGFTLIELMIVVAIIGILAGVAYPAYQDHIRKGNRSAAQSFMMEVSQRQQQQLIANRTYAQSLSTLGLTLPDDVSTFYTVAANLGVPSATDPSQGFNLQLTPKAGGTQATDGDLCLTNTGSRTRNCQSGGTPEPW